MPDEDPDPDTSEKVTRTDVGASIEATLKRGDSTRDEDRFKIKAKGENAEEAIDEFDKLLREYEEEYGTRLRNIDPERVPDTAEETDEE